MPSQSVAPSPLSPLSHLPQHERVDWECTHLPVMETAAYYGHVFRLDHATNGNRVWRCARCGGCTADVIEVDALALMLEGSRGFYRLLRRSVSWLEERGAASMLSAQLARPGFTEVAEAILELEGNADGWMCGSAINENGELAITAWEQAPPNTANAESIAMRYLEASALLRDGWRPRGASARRSARSGRKRRGGAL